MAVGNKTFSSGSRTILTVGMDATSNNSGNPISVAAPAKSWPTGDFGLSLDPLNITNREEMVANAGGSPFATSLTVVSRPNPIAHGSGVLAQHASFGSDFTAWQSLLPVPAVGTYLIKQAHSYATSTAYTNNSVLFGKLLVPRRISFDRMGCFIGVGGSTGSTLRMGLYLDDGSCMAPLLNTAPLCDTGAVSALAPTYNFTVVSGAVGPVTIDPGIYWTSIVLQGAPTTFPTIYCSTVYDIPTSTVLPAAGYVLPGVAAGLPNITATPAQLGFGFGLFPMVGLHVAGLL